MSPVITWVSDILCRVVKDLKMDADHVYLSSTDVDDGRCLHTSVVWCFNTEINVPLKVGERWDEKP
jgi:hypothetical protein